MPDRSDARRSPNYAAWANVVLGFLVFILRYESPRPSLEVHRNLFLTGIVLVFGALAAVIAHEGRATKNYWPAVNIAAGAWLLVSTRLFPSASSFVTTSQGAFGIAIILVALGALAIDFL